jgi:spermidine/putrescine transport system substrate-binding protein
MFFPLGVFFILVILAGFFTACGKAAANKLIVANWKGYASDRPYGAEAFAKQNNCKVEHYYYNSLEELLQTLKTGGRGQIDVICINPLYINAYNLEGVLQPITVSGLANYGDLMPGLRDVDEIKDAQGNILGVPWCWGSTALAYNPQTVSGAPDSWSLLWQNTGKTVGYFDEYYTAIVTAALYLGEPDPYNPDTGKVQNALLDLKVRTKTYWSSYDDWFKAYKSGEVTMGNLWSGAASQLILEGSPLVYTYPREGAVGWSDYWCLAADAPNLDLAMKWIDFSVGREFQLAMATDGEQANAPVNEKVIAALSDEQKKGLFIYPKVPDNLYLQLPQPEAQRAAWLKLWNDVKAAQ